MNKRLCPGELAAIKSIALKEIPLLAEAKGLKPGDVSSLKEFNRKIERIIIEIHNSCLDWEEREPLLSPLIELQINKIPRLMNPELIKKIQELNEKYNIQKKGFTSKLNPSSETSGGNSK